MKFNTLDKRIKEKYTNEDGHVEFTLISIQGEKENKCTIRHNSERCNNHIIEDISCKGDIYKGTYTCPECRRLNHKDEFIKKLGSEFSLIDDDPECGDYKNDNTKVKLRHNSDRCNHYQWPIKPRNFNGNCKECSRLERTKTTEEYAEEVYNINDGEYSLVEGETYVNNKTPIYHRHNSEKCNNYEWLIAPKLFLDGRKDNEDEEQFRTRCPVCRAEEQKMTIEEFKEKVYEIVGDEYSVLSENYVNNETHMLMQHNSEKCNYHKWYVRPNLFTGVQSTRCPECTIGQHFSKAEREIREYIESLTECYSEKESKNVLDGQDIDILTKMLTGFEYNGLYWHNEVFRGRSYHLDKTNLAANKDIRLIHIFEDEWIYKKDIVKSKISHILGKNDKPKIYARKCIVKPLINDKQTKMKNEFLERNHIQGKDSSNIKLGLFYEDKLVSVMTFKKPNDVYKGQRKCNYDYELSRFASDIDYNVIGSFSKLFKYFERNYKWNKLITYADKRWSVGNVYTKNGWIHTHDSKPTYWYCKGQKRESRRTYAKHTLAEQFPEIFEESLTEFEIMDKTGYFRVWDCGNMVFEYVR